MSGRRRLQWTDPVAKDALSCLAVDVPQTWQDRALCAEVDGEIFFPEKGGSIREAKKVCAACPVQSECLDYSLSHNLGFGIWGGLSERERRNLKREAA